jgi:hypothetical protein
LSEGDAEFAGSASFDGHLRTDGLAGPDGDDAVLAEIGAVRYDNTRRQWSGTLDRDLWAGPGR